MRIWYLVKQMWWNFFAKRVKRFLLVKTIFAEKLHHGCVTLRSSKNNPTQKRYPDNFPRKIAPKLALGFGLWLVLGLGAIFLRGNFPRTTGSIFSCFSHFLFLLKYLETIETSSIDAYVSIAKRWLKVQSWKLYNNK